jgi:hypothetical protein
LIEQHEDIEEGVLAQSDLASSDGGINLQKKMGSLAKLAILKFWLVGAAFSACGDQYGLGVSQLLCFS